MKRIAATALAALTLAAPARAAEDSRPYAQVPLVPLAEVTDDVATLLYTFWPSYYNGVGDNAFTRANVRVGRIDLNGDDRPELVLLVDAPGWEAEHGNPFVVSQWRKGLWAAVGWGWGDEDTVFATTETVGGWHSIDGGKVIMRWAGKEYRAEEKPEPEPR